MEKERKKKQDLIQKWMDMSEAEKDKERKLHREEEISLWSYKLDNYNWQLPEEKIERMREGFNERMRNEHLSDEKMAMVMSKKWSKEDSFAANFQRQLAKQRGHDEHEVNSAWICYECDSGYRYPSGLLLQRHYEVEHPDIQTLPWDPDMLIDKSIP